MELEVSLKKVGDLKMEGAYFQRNKKRDGGDFQEERYGVYGISMHILIIEL